MGWAGGVSSFDRVAARIEVIEEMAHVSDVLKLAARQFNEIGPK
jgi:hypothetical protein